MTTATKLAVQCPNCGSGDHAEATGFGGYHLCACCDVIFKPMTREERKELNRVFNKPFAERSALSMRNYAEAKMAEKREAKKAG